MWTINANPQWFLIHLSDHLGKLISVQIHARINILIPKDYENFSYFQLLSICLTFRGSNPSIHDGSWCSLRRVRKHLLVNVDNKCQSSMVCGSS